MGDFIERNLGRYVQAVFVFDWLIPPAAVPVQAARLG